ncbi:MAG: hypothetical protein IH973_02270 [Myxococcales bacterium]|nr:hypothetical protein [Myxococcales bacterium]
MQSDYQQLVRNRTSRGLVRELGLALLIAIVLGCILLPDMPGNAHIQAVGTAPPAIQSSSPHESERPEVIAAES